MKNNIEESVQVEMVQEDLRVLVKIIREVDLGLSKCDNKTFTDLVERVVKKYNGKSIDEAYKYFFKGES